MSEAVPGAGALPTPGIGRRMAAFLYEGVLLFGVVMAAGLAYGLATQQRHALDGLHGLQAVLFVVFGGYFVWFWTHSGQTLPMQTWHIRVLMQDGRPLTLPRACARYLLAWLWFVPAWLTAHLAGFRTAWPMVVCALAGVVTYALLARLHPDRQFLHDAACGTRLVTWRPQPRP
jgi:uncharacterized RDD family membrane protein YckC